MEDIFKTFVGPGAKILVPFLGSGNSLIAASNCNMTATGFEISQEFKDSFDVFVQETV